MNSSLILALDFADRNEVRAFLEPFEDQKLFLKIGMELFYKEGPAIVEELKGEGHQIFLDLKLHDIPNTVKRAMRNLASLGCDLVNVHAAGGKDMMMAAKEGLEAGCVGIAPKCIAVTQLTSTSQEQMQREQGIPLTIEESVLHYAKITKEAGLDGVVCSPQEGCLIRSRLGTEFLRVTPGIRLPSGDVHDQIRVATPRAARENGVSMIVVGRGITRARNPVEMYHKYKLDWEAGKYEENHS